jgi:BirA family transcriptional regulator, biotin operon repressor / biotin---[acetyl-CoA-carboxylase] ligase
MSATAPHGFRHEHHASIGSTNTEALARAAGGDPGQLWLTADEQTGGRGRSERVWSSPPGNLYATLLLVDSCPPRHAAGLGFVAGVALAQAIDATGISLKWPNDLLIGGAKAAGILVEGRFIGTRHAIAIGIGVNVTHHPDDTPYPATSLVKAGIGREPMALFARLAATFAERLADFDQGLGLARILERWKRLAHGVGQPITVKPPSGPVSGLFAGIDADGALLLRQGDEMTRISAGDVYFTGLGA